MQQKKSGLTEQVLKTIRRYDMVCPGDHIMVAFSGGPDSAFLLRSLHVLRKKLKLGSLSACHLDHGLRGDESRADAAFAGAFSSSLGIPCSVASADVRHAAGRGMSTEEAGRELRYAFFRDAALRAGANVIATGHTLDDQAETVMMRVIKGASLKGMAGIPPVRAEKGYRVIRPLIEIDKAAILRCLDAASMPYRVDRSNAETVYFRNAVRSEIIPFLERYNPRLKRALFNLAGHLRDDLAFIEESRSAAARADRQADGTIEMQLKDLVLLPKALQKEVVRDAIEKAGGCIKKLSFRHWKDIEDLVMRKGKGSAVDLPGDIRMMRTVRSLVLRKR